MLDYKQNNVNINAPPYAESNDFIHNHAHTVVLLTIVDLFICLLMFIIMFYSILNENNLQISVLPEVCNLEMGTSRPMQRGLLP